jgi:hypothetical protein
MLAQTLLSRLGASGCARRFASHRYRRMRRCPREPMGCTQAHLDHVRDGIPFAIQLADLLGIHLERQRNLMIVFSRRGFDRVQNQTAARSCVQNPHQRALRIAIAKVKGLHRIQLHSATECKDLGLHSSLSIISESAAPEGTIGKTFASGAQSNTSSSASSDRRKRSIRSPVSRDNGNSRMASSLRRQP